MSHKVSIHQPEYLPWLPFFDKIDQVDTFVLLDNVQFEKDYFQNRFKVAREDGSLLIVTNPVKKAKFSALINEREIDTSNKLFTKQLNQIKEIYRKAPFFEPVFKMFSDGLQSNSCLSVLNENLIRMICDYINLKTRLVTASSLGLTSVQGGTEVNLGICKALKADFYLSGKMGKDYLDLGSFDRERINVGFHSYEPQPYNQLGSNFVGYLSIIDALFNLGPETLEVIRKGRKPYEINKAG